MLIAYLKEIEEAFLGFVKDGKIIDLDKFKVEPSEEGSDSIIGYVPADYEDDFPIFTVYDIGKGTTYIFNPDGITKKVTTFELIKLGNL